MEININWLKEKNVCSEGTLFFKEHFKSIASHDKLIEKLIEYNRYEWAYWVLSRLFNANTTKIKFAIFSAELVLEIFEKKYPNDDRPRKAILVAKKYLKNKCNTDAAAAATDAYAAVAYAATYAAATDAYAAVAYAATYAAAAAAYAAVYAADAVTDAAATDDAYAAATYAAAAAAYAVVVKKSIIEYGLKLLDEEIKKSEYSRQYYQKHKKYLYSNHADWRKKNKEKIKKYNKQYRKKNKESLTEKSSQYYQKHKEKWKTIYKEQLLKSSRQYYKKNKEKIHKNQAIYRKKNKEKIAQKSHEYYLKNKECWKKRYQLRKQNKRD